MRYSTTKAINLEAHIARNREDPPVIFTSAS